MTRVLCRTALHYQILDYLEHQLLSQANTINHFKLASSKPKGNER